MYHSRHLYENSDFKPALMLSESKLLTHVAQGCADDKCHNCRANDTAARGEAKYPKRSGKDTSHEKDVTELN